MLKTPCPVLFTQPHQTFTSCCVARGPRWLHRLFLEQILTCHNILVNSFGIQINKQEVNMLICYGFFFLDFPIYLQSVYIHSNTISKLCVDKRGRVEECSVASIRDKRVKILCGCRETNKLSYNYINYTINLVGRSFDRWRRNRLPCS
jgi:hypothetical protein